MRTAALAVIVCCSASCATSHVTGNDAAALDGGTTFDSGASGYDAGRRVEAGRDGWVRPPPEPVCPQGVPCTPDRGCAVGECIAELATTLGSGMDPISGLPGGATTVPVTSWTGGYCTTNLATPVGRPGACDLDAPDYVDDGCGPCGQCVAAGLDPGGVVATLCVAACRPAATINPCRSGYTCSLELRGCVPGCSSDAECRVYREDTNHDGSLERGVDRLVYDPASRATCNAITGRCGQPAAMDATAGIPCERDSECEQDGECYAEASSGWPGGYCTKLGCDVAGIACAGSDAVCMRRPSAGPPSPASAGSQCFRGCAVGHEPIEDRLGPGGHGLGCRPGYRCAWDQSSGEGDPHNGACVPGNYNDVTANNIGAPCGSSGASGDPSLECYSPFGLGFCATPSVWGGVPALPGGVCTLLDCGAPGVDPAAPCGPGAQCVGAGGAVTLCLRNCTSAAECPPGYACGNVSPTPTEPHACLPNCTGDADCTPDRRCAIPPGEMIGRCVSR